MKKRSKNLIVCHDAGASEVISAYVKKNLGKFDFICLVAGPAENIFKRKNIKYSLIDFKQDPDDFFGNKKIDMVMTGMSWATKIGLDYLNAAKKRRIKTVVYLDHWVNYRRGFGYPVKGWKNNLPDEIWVGDKYALASAKKKFSGKIIRLVPNLYFKETREKYKKIKNRLTGKKNNILFMSEPVSAPASPFDKKSPYKFNEYYVLETLLRHLSGKEIKNEIVICFHPSESRDKYDYLIRKYSKKIRIRKQKEDAWREFARAFLVIGMMGMILVIAIICGKKTVSFIPDKKLKCPLPFDEIIKIRNVKDLDKLIKI